MFTSVARAGYGPGTVPNAGQLPAQPFGGGSPDGRLHSRPASGPGAVPNPGQLPRQPFAGSPGAGFSGPARNGHFGSGATLVGDEAGFTTYGGAVSPAHEGYPDGGDALPPPRVVLGVGASSCPPPPQIIRIGRGLTRPARTRVVYGAPSPCGLR